VRLFSVEDLSGPALSVVKMEKELQFSASEPFFAGHFPGRPVVPGVMLIDRAVSAARELLGRDAVLEGIGKVKFSNPVLPDEIIHLRMELRSETVVAYSFLKDGTACASGVLRFRG
jgi:3-hydroxymyristoyl/3-hydroxydecanoyl-(acyl carrier protein) dehydratase